MFFMQRWGLDAKDAVRDQVIRTLLAQTPGKRTIAVRIKLR